MEGDHIKLYKWLTPLSWLYGFGVRVRNILFDHDIMLHSRTFDIPVICVGNITVGGTGKTPHTEYLIRLLSKSHQVAVLSRGYKRKSKGYVLATSTTKVQDIGDEPFQMKKKFPFIHMAVDRDRCHGIEMLTKKGSINPPADVIILDDAFQHRYAKAGLNIVLMDYHRPIYLDRLMPAGRLREQQSGLDRADIIIITKCPPAITAAERQAMMNKLNAKSHQEVFFTTYRYPDSIEGIGEKPLLLTGIASPEQMVYDLKKIIPDFELMSFPDHHNFTDDDIKNIQQKAQGRTILTTEKDAARLQCYGISNMKVIPIEVAFIDDKEDGFNSLIRNFINSYTLEQKK